MSFKRKLTIISLLIIMLGLGLGGVIMKSNVTERAQFLSSHPLAVQLLPLYWQIRKISDLAYLSYYFKSNELPAYNLTINPKNWEKLINGLPKAFMSVQYTEKVYVPAVFQANNKTYQVKVRFRGDSAMHWNALKKSYLIKFDKDDLFPGGYRQLSFIIANDRNYALEQLNYYRAGKLGLMTPPSWFADLKVNGLGQAVYFVVENWNQEMLAKWEVPDESNFYTDEAATPAAGNANIISGQNKWNSLEGWDLLTEDGRYEYNHYTEIYQLIKVLNEEDDQKFYRDFFNLVDKDSLFGWQIMQELANGNHHEFGGVRLYFNNSSGKFYFIPWDVGGGGDGIWESHLGLYNPLTARIFGNKEFEQEKNEQLYEYIADGNNLTDDLKFYDQTYDQIKTAVYQDRVKIQTNKNADDFHQNYREKIIKTYENIKDKLKPIN